MIKSLLLSFALIPTLFSFAQNTFPSSGNAGIGTTSPNTKLVVAGTGAIITATDNASTQSISGFGNAKMFQLINTQANAVPSLVHLNASQNSTRPQFILSNSGSGEWAHNSLGMAVHGTSFSYSGVSDYYLNDATSDAGLALLWSQGTNISKFSIGSYDADPVSIFTSNTERVYITATGNVGIGTKNVNDANYKLFVETGIRTRKVKVDMANWADYVFSSSYKLPTLKVVEEFIKQHNHLPDVPSEAEVKKEGVDLGENQAMLLKKIEELTLYIIDQNKKLEDQNNRIENLEKRLSGSSKN